MTDSDDTAALERTPLYELHLDRGAKMVPFAGYEMPVQYPAGVLKEHVHTRSLAGLFDVSHMGQIRLSGPAAAEALETLVPIDVIDLPPGSQRYALFTGENGGVLDDLMVTNTGSALFLVVNAACKKQDLAHLEQHLGARCVIENLADRALLALQGPAAATVIEKFAPSLAELKFMQSTQFMLHGVTCFASRSGYTGEDGFEISMPNDNAVDIASALLEHDEVEMIGLGARDSLRLEAGLCLYGHDMDTTTTPVEANLRWALSKVRREGGHRAGGYPGARVIAEQLANGVSRKRVGIAPNSRAPVREGTALVDADGSNVGVITSGGFGPSAQAPVAMGYVSTANAVVGTELNALVRDKPRPVTVGKLPFVEHRYHRG